MKPTAENAISPLAFDAINWVASECLPRDREPSHRLHEPAGLLGTIDPITGRDVGNLSGRPYVVNGNMVMYFESEATREAYLETPIDHPFRLQDNPHDEWVAAG